MLFWEFEGLGVPKGMGLYTGDNTLHYIVI